MKRLPIIDTAGALHQSLAGVLGNSNQFAQDLDRVQTVLATRPNGHVVTPHGADVLELTPGQRSLITALQWQECRSGGSQEPVSAERLGAFLASLHDPRIQANVDAPEWLTAEAPITRPVSIEPRPNNGDLLILVGGSKGVIDGNYLHFHRLATGGGLHFKPMAPSDLHLDDTDSISKGPIHGDYLHFYRRGLNCHLIFKTVDGQPQVFATKFRVEVGHTSTFLPLSWIDSEWLASLVRALEQARLEPGQSAPPILADIKDIIRQRRGDAAHAKRRAEKFVNDATTALQGRGSIEIPKEVLNLYAQTVGQASNKQG